MAGKSCAAMPRGNPDPRESRAYAEGRTAAVASAASSTNPHVDGTPESLAWYRGWATWEAAGTDRYRDCTAYPVRIADRTGAVTEDVGDATGVTWDAVLTDPLPCMIRWGDGQEQQSVTGEESHEYPPVTQDYDVEWVVGELVIATDTAEVVYVAP